MGSKAAILVTHSNIFSLTLLIILGILSLSIIGGDVLFLRPHISRFPFGFGCYDMEFFLYIFTIIQLQKNKHLLSKNIVYYRAIMEPSNAK